MSTATMTTGTPSASAAGGSGCTGYSVGDNSWAVECGNGGGSGGSSGGGGTSVCTYITLAQAVQQYLVSQAVAAQYKPPPGYIYLVQNCPDQFFGAPAIVLYADGGRLTPKDLADQAYAELSPPTLTIGTAPIGREGLVGLPEWFWIDAAGYRTHSRTVALAGLSATVTATQGPLVINPGDGEASFTCPGPGTPYTTSEPASSQQSDCTFLYTQPSAGQPNNEFTVSISVTWTASWTGTGGTGGTLPPITRTTTIALPIAQAETVYSGG
ncbi:MAG: hypothetical protein ACRDOK_10825 [Streptosporangiaceae bacterium]